MESKFPIQNQNSINEISHNNAKMLDNNQRSKSKNIYAPSRHNKKPKNAYAYEKPKIPQHEPRTHNIKENDLSKINSNQDYALLKVLQSENEALKKQSIQYDILLSELEKMYNNQNLKIRELKKQYSKLKKFIEITEGLNACNHFINEKIEEEMALQAVEKQIMDELCPNPDAMSYEQLLQLEENVGSVNKGLTMDSIKKIPKVPFRKVLFEDNDNCIICMESFNENELVKQLNCGHIFHNDCIEHWLLEQKTCPFCKEEMC